MELAGTSSGTGTLSNGGGRPTKSVEYTARVAGIETF